MDKRLSHPLCRDSKRQQIVLLSNWLLFLKVSTSVFPQGGSTGLISTLIPMPVLAHQKCLPGRVTEAPEAQPGSVEAMSWLTQEVLTDPRRKWWNMEGETEITSGQTVKCAWKRTHRVSEGWEEVCVELGESFGVRPYVLLLVFVRAVFDECWSPQSWWQFWIPQQHTNRQFCIYPWSLWVGEDRSTEAKGRCGLLDRGRKVQAQEFTSSWAMFYCLGLLSPVVFLWSDFICFPGSEDHFTSGSSEFICWYTPGHTLKLSGWVRVLVNAAW